MKLLQVVAIISALETENFALSLSQKVRVALKKKVQVNYERPK